LIHICTIGRFILFGLMWLSAYLVAKQLSRLSHPVIMIALMIISPALTYLLRNPSDALFTAMSAFALWQVLSFYNKKEIRHVWLASLFVGLSALARNDGLVLFFIFIIIAVLLSIPVRRIKITLIASTAPFGIFAIGYFLIFGLLTGSFDSGIGRRAYSAFEQGQGFAYGYSVYDGTLDARRIYGTPEENQFSLLLAIKRQPKAFFDRVKAVIKTTPRNIYFMYGERAGIIILLLALAGAVEIARKRLYLLLMILLLWPAHLLIYFLTFFRSPYFIFLYFIILFFASVSLNAILYHMNQKRLYFWTALLLGLAILGVFLQRPNVFSAAIICLIGLWIIRIVVNQYQDHEARKPVAIILALSFLFLLKAEYALPRLRTLGVTPDEKAVLFMKKNLVPGSLVFAEAPGPVWTAKINFGALDFKFRDKNEQDIIERLHFFNANAVYVDNALRYFEPGLVSKIERLIGKGLDVGYESENKDVQVLLVKEDTYKKHTCSMQCQAKHKSAGYTK